MSYVTRLALNMQDIYSCTDVPDEHIALGQAALSYGGLSEGLPCADAFILCQLHSALVNYVEKNIKDFCLIKQTVTVPDWFK